MIDPVIAIVVSYLSLLLAALASSAASWCVSSNAALNAELKRVRQERDHMSSILGELAGQNCGGGGCTCPIEAEMLDEHEDDDEEWLYNQDEDEDEKCT